MVTTLCSSGAVVLKAGANAAQLTETQYTQLINQAEAYINTKTRINWNDIYTTLSGAVALILEDAASSHAAMGVINYDMSGFTSRSEAQTMLDVNYTRVTDAIAELKEKYASDYIQEV